MSEVNEINLPTDLVKFREIRARAKQIAKNRKRERKYKELKGREGN